MVQLHLHQRLTFVVSEIETLIYINIYERDTAKSKSIEIHVSKGIIKRTCQGMQMVVVTDEMRWWRRGGGEERTYWQ